MMFGPNQAEMSCCELSLMSTAGDQSAEMLKKMCLNSHTHLHKEEAGHDVGAGFLKASVWRKVPHCPLLC